MPKTSDILDGLGNELAQTIALYKNRRELFRSNGQVASGFSIREAVRSVLFAKTEAIGLVPIPALYFHDWVYDLVCLRELRIESAFLIRESKMEDYRQLLPQDF